jgi:hypothetical protein
MFDIVCGDPLHLDMLGIFNDLGEQLQLVTEDSVKVRVTN